MRLSRYFLPLLQETPAEAQIVSHQLMLRAGMIRQSSAGIYSWLPLGLRVLRRVEQIVREEMDSGRLPRGADADRPAGRALAGERPLRGLRQGDAAHHRPPRARDALRADPRGGDHRHLPPQRAQLPRPAAQPLPDPVEVPRRDPAALRRDARPRVPDEGQLLLRPRLRRREALLRQHVPRLSQDLPPHGPDRHADARGEWCDRRRHEPRVPRPRADRRERGVLRCRLRGDRLPRPGARRRGAQGPLRRDRRAPRPRQLPRPSRAPALGARHRGRPDLLFRHQVLQAARRHRDGAGRPGDPRRDGLLRHRRLAPGRRADRGLPRRRRHRLARAGGALPRRRGQPAARRCRLRSRRRRARERARPGRHRGAGRRPRGERRGQVRRDGPDRPALAGGGRPARRQAGRGRAQGAAAAASAASSRPRRWSRGSPPDVRPGRAADLRALPAAAPRGGLHLGDRAVLAARHRARRRHADRRAGGDERLSRRAARPRARPQRPRHAAQRPRGHGRLRRDRRPPARCSRRDVGDAARHRPGHGLGARRRLGRARARHPARGPRRARDARGPRPAGLDRQARAQTRSRSARAWPSAWRSSRANA